MRNTQNSPRTAEKSSLEPQCLIITHLLKPNKNKVLQNKISQIKHSAYQPTKNQETKSPVGNCIFHGFLSLRINHKRNRNFNKKPAFKSS